MMASRHAFRSTVARTTKGAAGRRRATEVAAGVLLAAALIGPPAANAGWSTQSPVGGNDPAGYGGAPTNGGGGGGGGGGGVREPSLPAVTAQAAIVVDRATGQVLGVKNPDLKWAPASTTKMMTGLLASEAIDAGEVSLSDIVTIPDEVDIEQRGGGAGLRGGDRISLEDLLHMMLVQSKGDAATAVAMYVGGYPSLSSLDARDLFIERMNERAGELGLDNTSFVDVSGRDPEDLRREGVDGYQQCTGDNQLSVAVAACAHFSTARDLAALARVLLDDPRLAAIVRTRSWTTTTWRRQVVPPAWFGLDYTESNSNQLLSGSNPYAGVYGVKTGTTNMARQNLVSAATNVAPDPGELAPGGPVQPSQSRALGSFSRTGVVAVVLGSDDTAVAGDRYSDSRTVLDFALHRP
jgi:D-alanyl-D-alanine carboxypeptidase (penicillin-binding protein 5/6)